MDKQIECIDCGQEFEFTEGEEKFYQEKGLEQPKRCKPCRAKKKAEKQRSGGGYSNDRPHKNFRSRDRYSRDRY